LKNMNTGSVPATSSGRTTWSVMVLPSTVRSRYGEPAAEEYEPAEADLARHHERSPVASDHEVRERQRTGGGQHGEEDERRARVERPAAARIEPLEHIARPRPGDRPGCEHARQASARFRLPLSAAGEQTARLEIGEQARDQHGAASSQRQLGLADEVGQRAASVDQAQESYVVLRHLDERPRREILQHPPARTFSGLQPLEGVARAQSRSSAKAG
jgi:hypothetical protein